MSLAHEIPTRPILRWHGGKWLLAPWIIAHFPPHRIYVEPFGGAASVLLRKPRSHGEIWNDLDDEAFALFKVLQSPAKSARLAALLEFTPFSRSAFEEAYRPTKAHVEKARRLIVRSFQGFGSDGHNREVKTGFRANAGQNNKHPAREWCGLPDSVMQAAGRMKGVVLENRPALDVLAQHDAPETLFYIDPPYMPETRSQKSKRGRLRYHAYSHEMTRADHEGLLHAVKSVKGMVVLSGYPNDLYEAELTGWERDERVALADGARERMEVLWLNPAAAEALGRARPHQAPLFE